jgi:hypothetical protein
MARVIYEWEGSYAYSSIVTGFLHLKVNIISLQSLRGVGIISLPNSRREIDGHKGGLHINYKFSLSAFQLLYWVFEDQEHFRTNPCPLTQEIGST